MKHDMMFFQVMRSKYDQFGGRAGRREFWLFWLTHVILLAVALLVDGFLVADGAPITGIYLTATFVPALALGARRLHDSGRSGWLMLLFAFLLPTAIFFGLFVGFADVFAFADVSVELGVLGALTLVFAIASVVGALILFIFALMPGDEGENAYGQPGEAPERPAVFWTVLTTRYAQFSGRAGRTEYWLYFLAIVLVVFSVANSLDARFFDGIASVTIEESSVENEEVGAENEESTRGLGGPIGLIAFLATLVPGLALGARRLHDTGRSGWWQLLHIFLGVGTIILIVFFIQRSNQGENSHGQPPVTPA